MNKQLAELTNVARVWYDIDWKTRYYHNWEHAMVVVAAVQLIDKNPSPELLLAALWHDAVYIAGAGSDANERCSAAALGNEGMKYDDPAIARIIEKSKMLIINTSIETHLHNTRISGDLATLLDADLFSLCVAYDDFVQKQTNIIYEMHGTYSKDQLKSAAFLKQFLTCRECIYHTDYARTMWESHARANIERYCKEQPLTS